jgi:hypothetical protein
MTIHKSLKFKSEFKELIISKRKITTIRLNKDFNEGEEINIMVGNEIIGKAIITRIMSTTIDKLTDIDAMKDGFKSKEELIKALKDIYGNKIKNHILYIIEFCLKD